MNVRRIDRSARLVRWRSFQELEAHARYLVEVTRTASRSQTFELARERLVELEEERTRSLASSVLDMARLGLIGSLERNAAELSDTRESELNDAMERRDAELSRYVDSRARTRVVENRHHDLAINACLAEEKRISDHNADLLVARRKR